jgi:hypothetical protein
MFWRSFAPVFCTFVWAASAHAQIPAVGTKIGSTIDLEARSVPLPQGIWTVVSVESAPSTKQNATVRVFLAELERGQLWRWLHIRTNIDYNKGGWRRNKDICDRKNVHFSYSDSAHNENDAECWIVNHWGQTLGDKPSQAAIDFYRWSDTLGRPNTSVGTAYFFVKKGDFLTVQYEINPVLAGFADTPTAEWRGNPWHVDMASKDPKKLSSLREVKAAGEKYFEQLRTVLH